MDPEGDLLGDRYRLESVLAGGGMGRVWRAHDTRLQRPVAVKILRSELTGDPAFLSRFRAEAQHAALLNHPHIAAVHDYGEAVREEERLAYLVMELVEGETLSDLLARTGRLDVPRTLRIVRQMASALAVAHSSGVVHRDVKPGNVLLTVDGDVKITDFGIAWSASSVPLTRTGQVIGTAHYLSPEQAQGAKAAPASDVYALGVVAYECLAGRRPFEGESSVQVALKQISEPLPPLPPDVPGDVRRLVERAMAKDPTARFADGEAFRDAVDAVDVAPAIRFPVVAHQETLVLAGAMHPPTAVLPRPAAVGLEEAADGPTTVAPPPDGRPRATRRGWAVVLGAALATLLVILGVVVVLGRGGSQDASTLEPTGGAPSPGPSPTTAAPTAVALRSAALVGRPLVDVQAELTALGLQVQPRPITTGDVPEGQVLAVDPVGQVPLGQPVAVTYAVAPPVQAGTRNGTGDREGNRNGHRKGKGNHEVD